MHLYNGKLMYLCNSLQRCVISSEIPLISNDKEIPWVLKFLELMLWLTSLIYIMEAILLLELYFKQELFKCKTELTME